MSPILPPIALEIIVLVLGIFLLLAESFSKEGDKSWLARTGIFVLTIVFAWTFFTTGNPPGEPGPGFWNFYSADAIAMFFKRIALLMFAHGLSIAALFALTGQLRQRSESLAFDQLGGLAKSLPFLSVAFGFAAFASIGLPGFANFASELMVFFGAYKPAAVAGTADHFKLATTFALWGVVISAVYMLRAYRAIFFGEPDKERTVTADPVFAIRLPILLLLATLLIAGFLPQTFLAFIKPSIEALLPK